MQLDITYLFTSSCLSCTGATTVCKEQIQSNNPDSVQKIPYFLKKVTKYLPNILAVPILVFKVSISMLQLFFLFFTCA